MRGVSLLSDMFLLIIIMVEVILMVGIIWVFQSVYGVESSLGLVNPRYVTLNVLFKPAKYESTFLSFLELDCTTCIQKISMKEIMNAVAIQESTTVEVKGEVIDAIQASEDLLNQMLDKKSYLLKIRNPQMVIAESQVLPASLQKVSTKLLLLDGEDVDLDLYVG